MLQVAELEARLEVAEMEATIARAEQKAAMEALRRREGVLYSLFAAIGHYWPPLLRVIPHPRSLIRLIPGTEAFLGLGFHHFRVLYTKR